MYFHLKQLVYPVHRDCTLSIEPEFPVRLIMGLEYSVQIYAFSGLRHYGLSLKENAPNQMDEAFFARRHPLIMRGDELKLGLVFPQEDCYRLSLYIGETLTETVELYALEEDLFALTPFKGDNHMHTWMSDGKDSPMYAAAAACRLGYDYCAITDHKRYEPSLLAKDYYSTTGLDLLIVPGEEVHSPDNHVHIINFGGRESVNDWWRDHEQEYRAAVANELETIVESMAERDRYAVAASQIMFDKIRAVDGISVLCHPSWILENGFNQSQDITDYLLSKRRFDALELIAGGAYEVGTQMQLSYYQDCPRMPILGSSDTHGFIGDKLEPGNYTIAFAGELSVDALKEAIRGGMTIAGNRNRLYGEYRLVKYGYFLLGNYFASHARLRSQLGAAMLRYASCSAEARPQLAEKLAEPRPSEIFRTLRYSC